LHTSTDGDFWAEEKDCSLLLKDSGCLTDQLCPDGAAFEEGKTAARLAALRARALGWLKALGVGEAEVAENQKAYDAYVASLQEGHEYERIFIRDSERAFRATTRRDVMMRVLTIFQDRTGDYHQGFGLFTAFLLLSMSPAEVLAASEVLSTDAKYVPEVWRAESVACATDGYVFADLLKQKCPDVWGLCDKLFLMPETYVQKWFCGMCVHVLPFSALFPFVEGFIEHGFTFLFRFGLSLVSVLREPLLASTNNGEAYAILRLEHATPDTCNSILESKNLEQYGDLSNYDFVAKRVELYDLHLRARMESAAAAQANEEQEETELCGFCAKVQAEDWCKGCNKPICDDCRDDPGNTAHDEDTHRVVMLEDKDMVFSDDEAEEQVDQLAEAIDKLNV
jgi:hypothetical protein